MKGTCRSLPMPPGWRAVEDVTEGRTSIDAEWRDDGAHIVVTFRLVQPGTHYESVKKALGRALAALGRETPG